MAENWVKFQTDLKKASAEAKKYTLSEATKLFNQLKVRDKSLETHEKALTKAVTVAYGKGVKANTLAEFMKDASFSDAKKGLDTDRRLLVAELEKLEDYCLDCDKASDALDKLLDQTAKALKANAKEKSAERTAVDKLYKDLNVKIKDINEATALRFRVEKYLTAFNAQYDKFIAHLIEDAIKKSDEKKEELPQPLVDKKLSAAHGEAEEFSKKLLVGVKDAGENADPKKAAAALKAAQVALTGLKAIKVRYAKVEKDFKKQIAASSSKVEIEKKIKAILEWFEEGQKAYTEAVLKLRQKKPDA